MNGDEVQTGDAGPVQQADRGPAKRSRKSRLIEFALWALLSIVTAVVMVLLSNKLLPNNF